MKIFDPVHGSEEINEPVLLDLLETAAMQRLHGVLQHGISGLVGITSPITRYEHSLGVMLLVRRLGASLEEQIAALLHDVSHTAFSHVMDYVYDGHDSQSYHEEMKESFLAASDIPAALLRYGYDWKAFLEDEAFSLLEQPSPALCADRLDYFMRDILPLGLGTPAQVQAALQHLVVFDRRIVTDDLETARWLAYTFIAADEASWANFREVGLYELAAQAIKTGLSLGVLVDSDIWGSDAAAWEKLAASEHPDLQAQVRLVSPSTQFVWDESAPDFHISTKLRTIDPPVLLDGEALPLSALDRGFARYRRDYLQAKAGKWPMRVVPGS